LLKLLRVDVGGDYFVIIEKVVIYNISYCPQRHKATSSANED